VIKIDPGIQNKKRRIASLGDVLQSPENVTVTGTVRSVESEEVREADLLSKKWGKRKAT